MKRTLIVVLALIVCAVSTGQAKKAARFESGVVTPGPGQLLRVTVVAPGTGEDPTVSFRRMQYVQGSCSGPVCKHMLASDSGPFGTTELSATEALSVDTTNSGSAVRVVLMSSRPDVEVLAQIIDVATGAVVSTYRPVCGCDGQTYGNTAK